MISQLCDNFLRSVKVHKTNQLKKIHRLGRNFFHDIVNQDSLGSTSCTFIESRQRFGETAISTFSVDVTLEMANFDNLRLNYTVL